MSNAFKPILARLAAGEVLSAADTHAFFSACLRGEPTPAQIAAMTATTRISVLRRIDSRWPMKPISSHPATSSTSTAIAVRPKEPDLCSCCSSMNRF